VITSQLLLSFLNLEQFQAFGVDGRRFQDFAFEMAFQDFMLDMRKVWTVLLERI
jgi:hypothetical protein